MQCCQASLTATGRLTPGAAAMPNSTRGLKKMFADQTPLGHVVTPEDVADTILSLITGSDYVTGQLVTLDSGFTL